MDNKSAEEILYNNISSRGGLTGVSFEQFKAMINGDSVEMRKGLEASFAAMHEYAQQAVRAEQEKHLERMKLCFEQSRLTHPMVGFKYDKFEDFMESEILKELK